MTSRLLVIRRGEMVVALARWSYRRLGTSYLSTTHLMGATVEMSHTTCRQSRCPAADG
jgi:hypothetical protein